MNFVSSKQNNLDYLIFHNLFLEKSGMISILFAMIYYLILILVVLF